MGREISCTGSYLVFLQANFPNLSLASVAGQATNGNDLLKDLVLSNKL